MKTPKSSPFQPLRLAVSPSQTIAALRRENEALRELLRQERLSTSADRLSTLVMERDAYRSALDDLVNAVREKRWAGGAVKDALNIADSLLYDRAKE